MKTAHLVLLATALVAVAVYLLFLAPGGGGVDLGPGAVTTTATVAMKDTRPGAEGGAANFVTLMFEDSMRRNHRVEIRVLSSGLFNSLETGKETRVRYQPASPEKVALEADTRGGVASPTLRFLAWSLLLAGLISGYSAYRQAGASSTPRSPGGGDVPVEGAPYSAPGGKRKGGPKVTITRR